MTFRWVRLLAIGLSALLALASVAFAEDVEITHRREHELRRFTDAQIIEGFFKVTFGAEFHIAGGIDRIRNTMGRSGSS